MKGAPLRFTFFFLCAAVSNTIAQTAPVITSVSAPRQVVRIGQTLTLSVEANGTPSPTYQWKRNGRPIPGATSRTRTIASASPIHDNGWYQAVVANASGTTTSAVVFVNVAVYPAQVLTAGNYGATPSPVPDDLTDVVAVAAGAGHWLALKADGTVAAWGYNAYGESTVPGGLSNVVGIAAGNYCSFALKADGSVVAWGDNGFKQTTLPAGLTNVISIAAGQSHALALRADGTVVGWGWDAEGQASPPSVLRNVVGIAAGQNNSFAWRADGTAVGWGSTFAGMVPTGATDVLDIASGEDFSIALKGDGTVVGWAAGYTGVGVVPGNLTKVVSIAAGLYHALALKADGSVVSWGETYTGPALSPANATSVVAIAAHDAYSVALGYRDVGTVPTVIVPSQSQTVVYGSTVVLSVQASATPGPTFQWTKDGAVIPGATNFALVISGATEVHAGNYAASVTNSFGTVVSDSITLALSSSANASRLINLSTRAPAGTGAQTLNLGFVLGGSSANTGTPVLLRAVGPSLAPFNVVGLLADPRFAVHSAGTKIDENDDWGGDPGLAAASGRVGAFPLDEETSKDAALYQPSFAPGLHTMVVTGFASTTGVVLAEVYDATPVDAKNPEAPQLINSSARARAGTGDDVLIVGFVIDGETSKTLLVRAIGPSLVAHGIDGVLANPRLQLFSGTTKIMENDYWEDAPAVTAAVFAQVGAFALPSDSKDAALLVTLPPGAYTAHVSGADGGTGVALAEIYVVP
ncbi:MAG TPA: immunoglobulin domain-containing protein [Opitutaceae bacterium]|nr:immunoglobulin domain-containing protein [Opitutaceae bacterium]